MQGTGTALLNRVARGGLTAKVAFEHHVKRGWGASCRVTWWESIPDREKRIRQSPMQRPGLACPRETVLEQNK